MKWYDEDHIALQKAKDLLSQKSFTVRLSEMVGNHLEKGMDKLPDNAKNLIQKATDKGLTSALKVAEKSLKEKESKSHETFHKISSMVTGGIGGIGGFSTLLVELPVTTTLIMRSILDIARHEGHNIQDALVQLEALQVFALGDLNDDSDDGAETSYYAVRTVMGQSLKVASKALAESGANKLSTSAVWQIIQKISARFGVTVTEKAAAQFLPIVGAIGGATVNTMFMSHFQRIARAHFILLRLEKRYGRLEVEGKMNRIKAPALPAPTEIKGLLE